MFISYLKTIKKARKKCLIEKYMDDQSMTSEKIVKDIQESIKVRHNIEQQDNKPMSFF
jgi:hypothetical protein